MDDISMIPDVPELDPHYENVLLAEIARLEAQIAALTTPKAPPPLRIKYPDPNEWSITQPWMRLMP